MLLDENDDAQNGNLEDPSPQGAGEAPELKDFAGGYHPAHLAQK